MQVGVQLGTRWAVPNSPVNNRCVTAHQFGIYMVAQISTQNIDSEEKPFQWLTNFGVAFTFIFH